MVPFAFGFEIKEPDTAVIVGLDIVAVIGKSDIETLGEEKYTVVIELDGSTVAVAEILVERDIPPGGFVA